MLQVNKMSLEDEVADHPLVFKLVDKTPGNILTVYIQTNNPEQKEQWTNQITSMLDMQGNFLRGKHNEHAIVVLGQGVRYLVILLPWE